MAESCKCKENTRSNNYGQCVECGKPKSKDQKPQRQYGED